MRVDIFIVSVAKHFSHLKYALRSINKFASGFNSVVLAVPRGDVEALYQQTEFDRFRQPNWFLCPFDEWPGKGMLHHMFLEMEAPNFCPFAEAILHFDSDWVFKEPVTPEDFLKDGKPVCMYASFDWLVNKQQANLIMWKEAVERAIGIPAPFEMMRWPQLIHIPPVYQTAENLIVAHNKMPMADYIKAQRNEFPQTFAEYPTLGMVAWEFYRDRYHWINQETEPFPKTLIHQNWSHISPTEENIRLYKALGLE